MSLRANVSKKLKIGTLLLSACIFSAGATVIDFTTTTYDDLDNRASYSTIVNDIGATMTINSAPRGAKLTWNEGSGIGIDYKGTDQLDEIDYPEILTISFNESVHLESITLSNFFDEEILGILPEIGKYRLANSSAYSTFYANSVDGWQTVKIGEDINMIQFTAPLALKILCHEFEFYDFSVASLSVSSVPEPTMVSMFGIGLMGFVGFAYRNRKK